MFEKILPKETIKIIERISPFLQDFYLSGGTALALQIGHRKSLDLDFFSHKEFSVDQLISLLRPQQIHSAQRGTLYCEIEGVRLSFIFYDIPLLFQPLIWRGIYIANWLDIVAEKFKTLSQRGAKRDFYDIYCTILLRSSIEETCKAFVRRFKDTGINFYHVLKSLVYFEDAEEEPEPILLIKDLRWDSVKDFFKKNIKEFERFLLPDL